MITQTCVTLTIMPDFLRRDLQANLYRKKESLNNFMGNMTTFDDVSIRTSINCSANGENGQMGDNEKDGHDENMNNLIKKKQSNRDKEQTIKINI